MKWIRCFSLAVLASIGMASVVQAGWFGSACKSEAGCGKAGSCATTGAACKPTIARPCTTNAYTYQRKVSCLKPPACGSGCTTGCSMTKKSGGLFSCFSKKDSACATTASCTTAKGPVCTTSSVCATQPKKSGGLFACFSKKDSACATTAPCATARPPVCTVPQRPACTTSSACATQPKKSSGLFSCLLGGKKKSGCATTAPCATAKPPACTTSSACATQPKKSGGLFSCFSKKDSACATTAPCATAKAPACTTSSACATQPKKSGGLFACFSGKSSKPACATTASCTTAKGCVNNGCTTANSRICDADPCEIAQLIYTSQTACYDWQRSRAVSKLGKYDAVCNPEVMVALLYALNDASESVRTEAADEIGDLIEDDKACCSPQVASALSCALGDCDYHVRRQAKEGLEACGYEVVDGNCGSSCGKNGCTTGCSSCGPHHVSAPMQSQPMAPSHAHPVVTPHHSVKPIPAPMKQPTPAAKPVIPEPKPMAPMPKVQDIKPLPPAPEAPAADKAGNTFYPSRLGNQQNSQSRVNDLFGSPN